MDSLTAIIHFIGLALFSTEVHGRDGELHVLLPRIEQQQHGNVFVRARGRGHGNGNGTVLRQIEPHVSAILVKESDLLQEIGWQSREVPPHMVAPSVSPAGYRMVTLDGEQVKFLPTGDNAAVQPSQLLLPKPSCASGRLVRNAELAADISIVAGSLSSCLDGVKNRYDTRMTLNNRAVMTIWAESGDRRRPNTRALVVKGDATVYVLNIPLSILTETAMPHNMTTPHYFAYYKLIQLTGRKCSRTLLMPGNVSACDPIPLHLDRHWPQDDGSAVMPMADSDCSNTAWP